MKCAYFGTTTTTITITINNLCEYFRTAKMGNEISVERKDVVVEMGSSTNINPQQLDFIANVGTVYYHTITAIWCW